MYLSFDKGFAMFDTIHVGMTGLESQSRGLNTISNNVANLNTVGFKGASLQFADLFYQEDIKNSMRGTGVTTGDTSISLKQGEVRQTGGDLDVMIDGNGLFVLKKGNDVFYSRNGQFEVDSSGYVIDKANGARLTFLDSSNALGELSVQGRRNSFPKVTSKVSFTGNLSLSDTQHTISGVNIYDSTGNAYPLNLQFENTSATSLGTWKVTVLDGAGAQVGTGELRFSGGKPVLGFDSLTVNFSPNTGITIPVTFDFASDTTSVVGSADSSLAVSKQDGVPPGGLTKVSFDQDGYLTLNYSNGQSEKFERIALAWFESGRALQQEGGNLFSIDPLAKPVLGHAATGAFGALKVGSLEMSNVDISQQFSELIITQRAYQASSHIITTANEMMQQLFDMKGRR